MSNRIMPRLPRAERRRLARARRKTKDADHSRRINIVELYSDGYSSVRIAEVLGCAPATAVRVVNRYVEGGLEGLVDRRCENGQPKVDEDLLEALRQMLSKTPEEFGWSRPTWTRELIAKQLSHETGVDVSITTVARMLKRIGARWGMPKPVVACPWPKEKKNRRIQRIRRTLRQLEPDEVAFYVDEVDIHLNPKIGRDWMPRAVQRTVLTPGKNQKRYLAGALRHDGGDLVCVESDKKNSDLFLLLLNALLRRFPKARRIHLVLDNYCIHSSRVVETYLANCNGRFKFHFLPPYCPDHNKIERLWRELHANVTRNHRCTSMSRLMERVRCYLRRETARRKRAETTPGRPARRKKAA